MSTEIHIGIDDTDSLKAGCTTFIAACLIELFSKEKIRFLDYPNIVRLNPNIPWKTRGNGAVCLRIIAPTQIYENIRELTIAYVEKNSKINLKETNPGVVFHQGVIPDVLREFSFKALNEVIRLDEAFKILKKCHSEAFGLNNGRGIIGALAAIGETLDGDHTYEAITYRLPENRGKPRRLEFQSIVEMDRATRPWTFNNIDPETGRVLITPRGPDPVLFGIRGESMEVVKKAMGMVRVFEAIERWAIFRTNHGTDAHLKKTCKIKDIPPYSAMVVEGLVAQSHRTIQGGHVVFTMEDETKKIDCAAYEPTGSFRNVVKALTVGDKIRIYGGIRKALPRHTYTVNIEKIEVLELTKKFELHNPKCPRCGKKMGSMGYRKGFRCEKCGYKDPKAEKILVEAPRDITCGLYVPPPRAHRHLTKPFLRYGLEKGGKTNSYRTYPKDFWGLGDGFPPKI